MFDTKRPPSPRTGQVHSGEGTGSMLALLQRRNVRPAAPDFSVTAWADTCPGSFERLWNGDGVRQEGRADEGFPGTMTMGLSEL
jgi:hypothetical protein